MARPFFLFAPGAGAPSSHPWMQDWKKRLAAIGEVAAFDYDYMQAGRRRPDPPNELIRVHRAALQKFRPADASGLILIGKSMGGRIGCHVALEEPAVSKLVCLGYPLCGGGDPTKLRDKVLHELRTPILFVQGTRDSLCPLDLLEKVRDQMTAPNKLYVVEGGDHSLRVGKRELSKREETQEQIDDRIQQAIAAFVSD